MEKKCAQVICCTLQQISAQYGLPKRMAPYLHFFSHQALGGATFQLCRLTGRDLDSLKPQHLHISVIPVTFTSTCLLTPYSSSCHLYSTVFFPSCQNHLTLLTGRFMTEISRCDVFETPKWINSIAQRCRYIYHCAAKSSNFNGNPCNYKFCVKLNDFLTQISLQVQVGHIYLLSIYIYICWFAAQDSSYF